MISRKDKRCRGESGFTLLETLVALVIKSLSLTIVIQSISGSFRTRALTQQTYEMAQLAESKLDELEVITTYPPSDSYGQINALYDWQASFHPYEITDEPGVQAYWMKVVVINTPSTDKTFELERLILFDLRDSP